MVEDRLNRLTGPAGVGKPPCLLEEVLDDERDVGERKFGIGHGRSPCGRGLKRLQDLLSLRDRGLAGLPLAGGFRRRGSRHDMTLRGR